MAELYILDQDDRLLTVITEETGLIEAPFREELNRISNQPFSFTVEADREEASYIVEENQVAFRDKEGDLRLFIIKELDELDDADGPQTTAICMPAFAEELQEHIVVEQNIISQSAQVALDAALVGTRWTGVVEGEFGQASTQFHYISSAVAVWNVLEVWGGDVKDVVVFDEQNHIVARNVKLLQRLGADNGKRFEIDHDITEIQRTILSYPVTALYGRGASLTTEGDEGGETQYLDFAAVEWSTASGDPTNKPLGQAWVGDPQALQKYGRQYEGELLHREGIWQDQDIEDPELLLQKTWEHLPKVSVPEVHYRLSVHLLEHMAGYDHEKVSLGDTARAIDRQFSKPIEIQTRIIAVEYDLTDIEGTAMVEMGQFLSVHEEDDRIDRIEADIDRNRGKWDSEAQPITNERYPNIKPQTPANARAEGGFQVIQLYWDYSNEVYVHYYEVYGSQVKDFVPDRQHLLWRGKVGAFAHNVETDQQWYYRIRAVNTHGTASDFTHEVTASTVRVITDDLLFGEDLAARLRELNEVSRIIGENGVDFDQISEVAKNIIQQEARTYTDEEIEEKRQELMQEIAKKAGLEYVDGQLQLKVDQADFDNLQNTVIDLNSTINDIEIDIANKVDAEWVDGRLLTKADKDNTYTIEQVDNALNAKVSLTEYDVDKDGFIIRFEDNETAIIQNAEQIEQRATRTEFEELEDNVGGISTRLSDAETAITQSAEAISLIATKTESLDERVTANKSSIEINAEAIEQKVSLSEYETDQDTLNQRIGSAESLIQQNADEILQRVTVTEFEGLQISGRNLVLNSAFKGGSGDYWSGFFSIADEGTFSDHSALFVGSPTGSRHMNSTIVYESGTYTATIWYKHLSGDLPYLFKHSDINIEGGSVVTPFIEGEGWQRVDVTFTIPEGYTSQFYHLRYAQSSPPEHLDGETLIGAIKIIKGTKATTDWTEAPEDLDSNINNIDSRLVSAESSITQNAEAIESRVSITDYTTDQNNIISRLDSAETSITQNADSIESRVTVTQFTDGLARKGNVYRAVARAWNGGGSNRYPTPSGLYDEEGDLIPYEPSGNDRSFILYVMNRSKEEWIFAKRYDVWSSSDEASNLADDLSSYDENYLIVLIACHSPEQNKNTGGLPEQIYRCGGSESVYMSDGWGGSASYILIGIPNMGEGAGLEHFRKARSSDTYGGWLDITFNIKDGTVDFGDSRGYVASNRINVAESLITQNADAIQLRVTEEHFGNVINNLETDINQRAREYRINFPFSSSRDYVILLCRSNLTGASNFAVGTLTGRRVSGHYSSGEVKVVFNNSSDGSRASGYHEAIDVHYTDSWSMVTCTYNGQSYVGLRHNTGNDFGLWNTDCRFYGQIGSSSEMLLPVETSNLTNVQTFNSVGGVSSPYLRAESQITQLANEINLKVDVDGIVSAINLSQEGVRIRSNLIHLNGLTLIDNGVIQNAHIANLSADKVTFGTMHGNRIQVNTLNANRLNLSTLVVDTANIADGSVTNAKIANLSVDKLIGSTASFVRNNWNNTTSQVQITGLGLETLSNNNRTSLLNGNGHSFYRDNNHIGNIGASHWTTNASHRGLSFNMTNACGYMSWSHDDNNNGIYTQKLAWHKDDTVTNAGFTISDNIYSSYRLYISGLSSHGYSDGNRHLDLQNYTWNGTAMLALRRGSSGAKVALGTSIGVLMNSGNAYIQVGATSPSGNYVRSVDIWNRTSSNSANVRVADSGNLLRSTSASKYKLLIEDEETKGFDYERILDLTVKSWYDKGSCEVYATCLSEGYDTKQEDIQLRRNFGLIAEDVRDVGLDQFVEYGEDGAEIEGIEYDRLWVLLIPTIRKLKANFEDEMNWIKIENQYLKGKIKELEEKIA